MEEEGDALAGIGQHARGPDNHQQQDEQGGHHRLRGPFNAVAHAMQDDEMGDAQEEHGPENRFEGVAAELAEIGADVVGVAMQVAGDRGIQILQTPARHHGIVARDEKPRDDTEITHNPPRLASRQFRVGTCRIRLGMSADDELIDHAGDAEKQDAADI